MDSLFDNPEHLSPLAHRMRPKNLGEFYGQSHLIGQGKFITQIMETESCPSLIFWGPPGTGKTTLALLTAQKKKCRFESLSAVTSGIKEVKEMIAGASEQLKLYQKRTILFIDEIHRFNKAQQDALLPHIENGTVIFFGATTENPSFEVISPLLSRCKVLVLKPLEASELEQILIQALKEISYSITQDASKYLCEMSYGDARRLLNSLETAANLCQTKEISIHDVEAALQKIWLPHDKKGEEHYNLISAFIKSMRGSHPDAAIYYLARLLEAGEDPLFVARRMIIFASEDIGNADPNALTVALHSQQAFHFIGMPEGWIPLSQAAIYLACAPKSRTSYMAYLDAKSDVLQYGPLPVPLYLRNAPTEFMKELGYGKPNPAMQGEYLPEKLKGKKYYKQ